MKTDYGNHLCTEHNWIFFLKKGKTWVDTKIWCTEHGKALPSLVFAYRTIGLWKHIWQVLGQKQKQSLPWTWCMSQTVYHLDFPLGKQEFNQLINTGFLILILRHPDGWTHLLRIHLFWKYFNVFFFLGWHFLSKRQLKKNCWTTLCPDGALPWQSIQYTNSLQTRWTSIYPGNWS